ncbi:hypothetical protein F4803DRAFT_428385 [Xylaria telfairii]|nr:hypothetical protein F4803DRAFT_428385 [Xylaria telfairii]
MAYSGSRHRREPAHHEFYANPAFSVGPNDALNNNSPYRSDAISTISGSCSFGYALHQLAPGASGLPYQPMALDTALDYNYVEPNDHWPTLDSAQFCSGYPDTPGHNTYSADPAKWEAGGHMDMDLDPEYSMPPGSSINTPWNPWYPQTAGLGPRPSPSPTLLALTPPLSPTPLALAGAADARPFPCSGCPSSFKHRKDLKRHVTSVHATGNEPVYRCRCGFQGVRKDNYLRHVSRCNEEPCYPAYSCKCEDACVDKEMHSEHVRPCRYGFGSVGRPRAF